jgi:hypothetical protein
MDTEQKNTYSKFDDISTICISSEEKNIENKIIRPKPKFVLSKNKKYKNYVHCYHCQVEDCQKLFKTNREYLEHNKEHTQLYICHIKDCNKSYSGEINFKRHLKNHFPSKNKFHCNFNGCNKSFTTSYNLNIHLRIHNNKKPFKCQICEKSFCNKSNYKYHISSQHLNTDLNKLNCQHKNCNFTSRTIKQKLMHHYKLEEICIQEKSLLLGLLIMFQKSSISLLNSAGEPKNDKSKNKNNDCKANNEDTIKEIKNFDLDNELLEEFNSITKQSKILLNCALDRDQYKGLIDNSIN